jgi:hypothetical protein
MTDHDIKRVSDVSVKAVNDETNWEQIYSQSEESIVKNIDQESPELKYATYRKSESKS